VFCRSRPRPAEHPPYALADLIRDHLGELSPEGATYFAAGTLVTTTGIWPMAQPSEAMLCVYEDPAMASLRLDFGTAIQEMLATLLAGCLTRWPAEHDGRGGAGPRPTG
jgi:hypothetical protein